ncbi:MAG: hypothetical protein FWC97_12500 [Treponema sp.]|nr:hypothetical protein [Treponema sp.]
MKKRWLLVLLVVCIGVGLSGCTTFRASGLQMGIENTEHEILGYFFTVVPINRFFGVSGGPTLFNNRAWVADVVVQEVVMREVRIRNGDAAINVSITYGATLLQHFLNSLTLSIWAPSVVTVSGTVIRHPQP